MLPTCIANRLLAAAIGAASALAGFAAPVPARAATAPDGFCTASPQDRLAALDGRWSLKQGLGAATIGAMTIPLPPHGAQSMMKSGMRGARKN